MHVAKSLASRSQRRGLSVGNGTGAAPRVRGGLPRFGITFSNNKFTLRRGQLLNVLLCVDLLRLGHFLLLEVWSLGCNHRLEREEVMLKYYLRIKALTFFFIRIAKIPICLSKRLFSGFLDCNCLTRGSGEYLD